MGRMIEGNPTLIDSLVHVVCAHEDHVSDSAGLSGRTPSNLWPSLATVQISRPRNYLNQIFANVIMGWAAAGVLKNLALSPTAREQILKVKMVTGKNGGGGGSTTTTSVETCLCQMQHSPDWLEKIKSEAALVRLGIERGQQQDFFAK